MCWHGDLTQIAVFVLSRSSTTIHAVIVPVFSACPLSRQCRIHSVPGAIYIDSGQRVTRHVLRNIVPGSFWSRCEWGMSENPIKSWIQCQSLLINSNNMRCITNVLDESAQSVGFYLIDDWRYFLSCLHGKCNQLNKLLYPQKFKMSLPWFMPCMFLHIVYRE